MIRSSSFRLLALGAGVAVVMSCDAGSPSGLGELPGSGAGAGTGGAAIGGDGRFPTVSIDTPVVNGHLVNVGDSILVAVRVRDNQSGLRSLTISGLSVKGDPNVGTQVITERYQTVTAPVTGTFPAGTAVRADTTIRRILFPRTPVDSLPDSLVIRAIAVDHSGLADTTTKVVRLVAGPRVQILTPIAGDSVRPGTRINIQFRATHVDGVAEARLRVTGDPSWPTKLDSIFRPFTYIGGPREVVDTASIIIPADAPARSRVTITVDATDVNRTPGAAAPVSIFIRASEAAVPMVKQTVPPRAELGDTVLINASGGNGIRSVGFIVRDSAGTGPVIKRDSVLLSGNDANVLVRLSLALPQSVQGRTVAVTSFATDRSGRTGYAASATATTPIELLSAGVKDTVLVVYGRTFAMPRPGLGGDLAVDPLRGHVFVSNTKFNRLEVWRAGGVAGFDANGVSVGAEPWGMTIAANNANELLVANSGGTNISRVNIGSSTVSSITESNRILTRNTVAYTVTESRDEKTGKIRIVVTGPVSYSDRPQYIAQAAGGRIYYSTRPTQAAPVGTLRFLDPAQPVPDSRQVFHYGTPNRSPGMLTLFNVDAVSVVAAPADSPLSDSLVVCDHATGTANAPVCTGSRGGTIAAIDAVRTLLGGASDAYAVDIDIQSLALTDTTFVTWSGDRTWIGFGEGNKKGGARVMLANDPAGTDWRNIFFSPGLDVADLVDNASESVYGIALDRHGRSLAVHGTKTYFGAVEQPFHLRMQGQYDTFDFGSGVAFHPQANVNPATPGDRNDPTRLAFVASENGTIEIVDAYYFVSRGRIAVRNKLYGPLRASLPLSAAEAAAGVVVKLYGLTSQGLVVIDVTAADIRNVP